MTWQSIHCFDIEEANCILRRLRLLLLHDFSFLQDELAFTLGPRSSFHAFCGSVRCRGAGRLRILHEASGLTKWSRWSPVKFQVAFRFPALCTDLPLHFRWGSSGFRGCPARSWQNTAIAERAYPFRLEESTSLNTQYTQWVKEISDRASELFDSRYCNTKQLDLVDEHTPKSYIKRCIFSAKCARSQTCFLAKLPGKIITVHKTTGVADLFNWKIAQK